MLQVLQGDTSVAECCVVGSLQKSIDFTRKGSSFGVGCVGGLG